VGATEITREQLCAEISGVIAEAVERGELTHKEAGALVGNCESFAG
jgi:hypothetical protein